MATKPEVTTFLAQLETDDPVWLNTKSCDVFVTRILSHKFDFSFGIRKVLTCCGPNGDQVLSLPIHATTCDMCDYVESRYSLDDAADFLCILLSESKCMGCDNVFSGYAPHKYLCSTCFLTCTKRAVDGSRCLICFSADKELLSETVVACPTCQQIVCHPCSCKLVPDCDTSMQCPHCRGKYEWHENTVIIKSSDTVTTAN